jgi:cytosine/adenosine deaminase-related metal-dependent hydrolase
MKYVNGPIFYQNKFIDGSLGFENGVIKEIGKDYAKNPIARGIIIPCFCNSHTHIGDAFLSDVAEGTLEELVAPPDGLKHRMLRMASSGEIIRGMKLALNEMLYSGTDSFCDFREGSVKGVLQLTTALDKTPITSMILGRPQNLEYSKDEVERILKRTDGIGISSISDWDYSEVEKLAKHVKEKEKIFSLHASERTREDVDKVLDLKPDFLVHMTKGSNSDLERVSDNDAPIVVCPRSNAFFGTLPNVPAMLEKNITVLLGTDNAMINRPSMFREMEFAYKISKIYGKIDPLKILKMATSNIKKVLNHTDDIDITEGVAANFIVIRASSRKPQITMVNRACENDIILISMGKFLWRK